MWPFKTGCDCLRKKDQNIVVAETITEEQAFVSYMETNNIDFELKEINFLIAVEYIINIFRDKNYEVHYHPSTNALFEKRACLTCKKCMGWYMSRQGYLSQQRYWDEICGDPLSSKILENGFNIYVNNQIEQIKLEENMKKGWQAEADRLREERKEAIKICG